MLDIDSLPPERLRPLRRVEYDRMVEVGLFEDERVELLDGFLVAMSPQGPPHAGTTGFIAKRLTIALGDRAEVRTQMPFALDDLSEPEPDVAVVPPGGYRNAHPATAFLVVEVAETSLRKDRGAKALLYARAGVPELWIVDVVGRAVHVLRDPGPNGYASDRRALPGESVRPLAFPEVALEVGDIVPCPDSPRPGR